MPGVSRMTRKTVRLAKFAGPFRLAAKMLNMTVIAFGTISSAVTLPIAMEDTKKRIGCDPDIADLLLPLGMPLNSNGVAVHLAVTALTIAQMYGISFGVGQLIKIAIPAQAGSRRSSGEAARPCTGSKETSSGSGKDATKPSSTPMLWTRVLSTG